MSLPVCYRSLWTYSASTRAISLLAAAPDRLLSLPYHLHSPGLAEFTGLRFSVINYPQIQ